MSSDGFISYSHAADGQLAPALQRGLQQMAKPWNRRRALRIFRDETGLSTNPHLWSAIETALDGSDWFVLLASPEAAQSDWVNKEISHWLATKSADRVLPVVTDGTWDWDASTGEFAAGSTAVPAALRGAFHDEPRHLDLRWARAETDLHLRNTRFRDAIADLAAPMHGVAKDDLESEDVRQHRRTLRYASAAGVALVLLTLASIATTAFAVSAAGAARRSAARARTEQHRADIQANLASRESTAATKARKLADQRRKDADRQRGLADERSREVTAANGKLVLVNGQLVDQQSQTERQRAAAVKNATEADQQRALAEQRAGDLRTANGQLVTVNGSLVSQQQATEDQRLAGVARQLTLGSQASLAGGVTDRALLLAAQATNFAARSGGLISAADVRPALVEALGRNPRQVGTLRGLGGAIANVAVSSDGSRAAAVSVDGRAGVWRLSDRRLLSTFAVPTDADRIRFIEPNSVVVSAPLRVGAYHSPDGGNTWTPTWTLRATNTDQFGEIDATRSRVLVARSNAASTTTRVILLDANGRELSSVVVTDPVQRITLAPSGTSFATGGLGPNPADPSGLTSRAFVHVFTAGGTQIASLGVSSTGASSGLFGGGDIRFSPDGRQITVLVGGMDVPVYRWDVATGHQLPVPAPPTGWGAVVPDEPIGLSLDSNAVVQRDPNNPDLVAIGHLDSGTLTVGLSAPVVTSNLFGAGVDANLPPAFTPDGKTLLLGAGDGVVPIFEVPEIPVSHFAHTKSLAQSDATQAIAISPDGRLLASVVSIHQRGTLHFDALDGARAPRDIRLGNPAAGSNLPVSHPLAFDHRGDEVAVANVDGSVDVFDTEGGRRRIHLDGQRTCGAGGPCTPDLAFSGSLRSGRIAETYDNELWIWTLRSGTAGARHVVRFRGAYSTFLPRLSASGSRLVVASFNIVRFQLTAHVFDATARGWSERASFDAATGYDWSLSPDGTRAVEVDGGHVTMFDLDRGRVIWKVEGNDQAVWFTADGSLYTATGTGAIRARSTEAGDVEYTLDSTLPDNLFTSSSPDALVSAGSHLIAHSTQTVLGPTGFGSAGTITDWPLATTDLAAAACRTAGRNLTPAEWKHYVGDFDPYEPTCGEVPVATAPAGGAGPLHSLHTVVNGFSTPTGHGYWLAFANGSVTTNGTARSYGDASALRLNGPIVGGAVVPAGTGYWLVGRDGGVFTYGTGRFYGSMGATPLSRPVFSMAPTKSGKGDWLVGGDGGIFSFGDARFYGSTGNLQLSQPITGITTSPTGKGYRMIGRDGGIFSFGDAPFYGSLPGLGIDVTDVVGFAPTPSNRGYWIARRDGHVYAFGDAKSFGDYRPSACDPVAAIFANPGTQGYRLVTASGATIPFGTAPAGNTPTGTPTQCST